MVLHGRADELHELERHRSAVGGRAGRGITIVGPAGIGKSTLLRATVDEARGHGFRVLWARGSEAERAVPYGVVRQLLEPVADQIVPTTVAAGRGRAFVLGESLGLDADRARLDLCWYVADIAAGGPTAICVDDLHWVDGESLRVLDLLRTRLDELPVLLLVATRQVPTGSWGTDSEMQHLDVGPLPVEGVRGMLLDELGEGGDDLVAAMVEVTGGNPFLVREVANSLRRSTPGAGVDAAAVRSVVPDAIVRATAARLDQLGADAAMLARATAILGDDCELHVAAAVAGLTQAPGPAVDVLCAEGILAPIRPLRFGHPLLLAAVRESISGEERSALHARAAHLLHTEPGGLDLACAHLLEVDSAGDPSVVELLRRGASEAMRRGLPDAAIAYLRRALAEPPPPDGESAILTDLASAAYRANSPDALELARIALDRASDPSAAATAALSAGHLLTFVGRIDEAIDLVSATVATPGVPAPLVDLGMNLVLAWSVCIPRSSTPPGLVVRAREVAGRPDSPPALQSAIALELALATGSAAECTQAVRRAWADGSLARDSPPGTPFVHYLIIAAAISGEMGLVERWTDRCLDLAAARGDAVSRSVSVIWRGWLGEASGDLQAAIAYTLESGEGAHSSLLGAFQIAILGEATLLTEGPAAAARALDLLPTPARDPHTFGAPIWYLARASVALADGRPADALADAGEVDAWQRIWPAPHGGWSMWHALAVEAHLALGDDELANGLAQAGLQRATAFGAPRPLARALRAAALTLPVEKRAGVLEEALEVSTRGWCGLDGARIQIDLGRAAAAVGDLEGATSHLQMALDAAERTGAAALAATVIEVAKEVGASVRRPTHRPGLTALSPAERRVVDLAVEARSNRTIAEMLFVSEKTVESHLTAAYRKLGVRGREDLAAAVRDARD